MPNGSSRDVGSDRLELHVGRRRRNQAAAQFDRGRFGADQRDAGRKPDSVQQALLLERFEDEMP